jgi:hypothetical protein
MTRPFRGLPRKVTVKITDQAWDKVCAHATQYGASVHEVLEQIIIDVTSVPDAPIPAQQTFHVKQGKKK